MLTTRRLLTTTLLLLSCAALLTAGPAFAAASTAGAPGASATARPHGARARDAAVGCANQSSALTHRAARRAARACRARARALARANRRQLRNTLKRNRVRSRRRIAAQHTPATPEASAAGETPSAQSDAATIASVLATPCQNTELTPAPQNIQLVRAAILCLINRKRAENSESPLEASAQLEQAAEGHCQELIADDYFAHVSPSGETPVDRIRSTGYIPSPSDGYVIGENLAWGTYQLSTPQSIVSAWFASPGHLANILEAQYRQTGIGVIASVPASLAEGSPGATYAQEFGVIIR